MFNNLKYYFAVINYAKPLFLAKKNWGIYPVQTNFFICTIMEHSDVLTVVVEIAEALPGWQRQIGAQRSLYLYQESKIAQ